MKLTNYLQMIIALFIVGCGAVSTSDTNADGSAKDPHKIVPVSYTLNGSSFPTCNKPAIITAGEAQDEDDTGVVLCRWICGDYAGEKPVIVVLSFIQDGKGEVWEFNDEVISPPSQECHN